MFQHLGIVSSFVVVGVSVTDAGVQLEWDAAMETAQKDIAAKASSIGANAILGVKVDTYKSGADYLHITGTAVKLS